MLGVPVRFPGEAPNLPPAAQQPDWPDRAALHAATAELASLPGLVAAAESDALRDRLARVARGEAVLLQGGDCAESLDGATPERVGGKFGLLGRMAAVLTEGSGLPVVQLGRIAGQYAKPRSSPLETLDGVTLPVYRGDLVNGCDFTARDRTPDPSRLIRAYGAASATLGMLRELTARHGTELWTSHEALVLEYERGLTRTTPAGTYDLSAHLVWIGERTRALDGAHIDFAAGIRNPVAVKLGPTTTPDEALALVDRLDPERRPGRLTFITRMGAEAVRDVLPDLVAKVTADGAEVVWVCDPMHGNTFTAPSGHKTRHYDTVIDEVRGFFEVHRALGTHPGGIHAELTAEDVTECLGGSCAISPDEVPDRYESTCDPRLNACQALDLAHELAARYVRHLDGA
ncbi:3-deoxy-7-phosphoheptulonate synthase class II [Streptomyces sp. NPDC093589]|uniref:3-deoxy-7-phosphoheptulonate synthase class II n=1 Tax=Streptomyces sp. NPDC093589 TaxID=3366043 RepID=UPI0037FC5A3F